MAKKKRLIFLEFGHYKLFFSKLLLTLIFAFLGYISFQVLELIPILILAKFFAWVLLTYVLNFHAIIWVFLEEILIILNFEVI